MITQQATLLLIRHYFQSIDQMKPTLFKISQKQIQFQKEKVHYNQIIQSLTKQNLMLRQQLSNFRHSKQTPSDLHHAQTKEDQSTILDSRKSRQSRTDSIKQTAVNSIQLEKQTNQDLVRQNQFLREQLDRKTKQYQKRISQLSDFLARLKLRQNLQILQFNSSAQISAVGRLVENMEAIVKMFESDRLAFICKIEQLLLLISSYQRRQKESELKQRKLQMQLQIASEQILIFKRLQKSK